MLFVSRADIDRIQDAIAAAKLYDGNGNLVRLGPFAVPPTDSDAEMAALAGLSSLASTVYRRHEVVMPSDQQEFTRDEHGNHQPLYTPPKLSGLPA